MFSKKRVHARYAVLSAYSLQHHPAVRLSQVILSLSLLVALLVQSAHALTQIEAENFSLNTYLIENNAFASGGKFISLLQASGDTGVASTVFKGAPGIYSVVVTYLDENDGRATLDFRVNGSVVDSWTLNQALGAGGPRQQVFTSRTISGVSLQSGDTLAIVGGRDAGENARVDFIQLIDENAIFEAEEASMSPGFKVAQNHRGFTGAGFVDFIKEGFVEWTVPSDHQGGYALRIRYALGSDTGGDRPLKVMVNGAIVASSLRFPHTGRFTIWQTADVIVKLIEGDNTIRIETTGSSGANVDHLAVTSLNPGEAPNILEAEAWATGLDVLNDLEGFTGAGFVELVDGSSIHFTVEVPDAMHGVYQIEVRSALLDSASPASVELRVDGVPVDDGIQLEPGPATLWQTKALHRRLQSGLHEIELRAPATDSTQVAALIDHIRFTMTPPDQDRFLTFPRRVNHAFFAGSNSNTNAYYATIDPNGDRSTFAKFLERNGFTSNGVSVFNENEANSAHATYQNVADLNFGRDMYVKKALNGDVASYVQNYPTVEDALSQTNLIATVAMEYRAPDNDLNSPKFTTFYVYGPDGARLNQVDLDGRGAKFVPTVCNTCHGGKPKRHDGLLYQDEGETNAKWIPWDLDNFAYSPIKPRDAQEGQFRKLNRLTLCANPSSANSILVKGWYSDPDASCSQIEPNLFNSEFVPTGWAGHETLYLEVVAPSCRSCHAQRGSYNVRGRVSLVRGLKEQSLEFNSFSAFEGYKEEIERLVYDEGIMPAAKETFERFWRSDQPIILDNELFGGFAHINPPADKYPGIAKFDFGERRKPGRPIAAIAGARLLTPGFPFDHYVNSDVASGERARLNLRPSQFAETARWFLESGPTTPSLFPSSLSVTSFLPHSVLSDIRGPDSNSPYIIRLSVSNKHAGYNEIIQTQQWSNSGLAPIVFSDVFEVLNQVSSSAGSCFNCHANNSVNAHADSIYNLRDTAFTDTSTNQDVVDSNRKRFAYLQALSRVDCDNPENSLLLRKPAGYHHGANRQLSGFQEGQANWELLRRWVVEGAKFDDGAAGCPESLVLIPPIITLPVAQ